MPLYVYSPNKHLNVNLDKIGEILGKDYEIKVLGKLGITLLDRNLKIKVSILKSGNLIISGLTKKEIIEKIANDLMQLLNSMK